MTQSEVDREMTMGGLSREAYFAFVSTVSSLVYEKWLTLWRGEDLKTHQPLQDSDAIPTLQQHLRLIKLHAKIRIDSPLSPKDFENATNTYQEMQGYLERDSEGLSDFCSRVLEFDHVRRYPEIRERWQHYQVLTKAQALQEKQPVAIQ